MLKYLIVVRGPEATARAAAEKQRIPVEHSKLSRSGFETFLVTTPMSRLAAVWHINTWMDCDLLHDEEGRKNGSLLYFAPCDDGMSEFVSKFLK